MSNSGNMIAQDLPNQNLYIGKSRLTDARSIVNKTLNSYTRTTNCNLHS